ncbi:MAG: copper amine oxidase [Oscillospiraceae bacterium]|nr:copper amine oxidase [Oscillospiraceae bacterium]
MKRRQKLTYFLAGLLSALLLAGAVNPALAAMAGKTIQVFTGVNIYIDDVKLNPKDANGNPVEAFIYNGTTYLPVRAVSEALGKPVQWEGKTQSVYVGKHSSDTPAVYLSQLDYFNNAGAGSWHLGEITKDNLGNEHSYSLATSNGNNSSITYKLNGQYTKLTGLYYQKYEDRSRDHDAITLVISGDGRELWHGSVGPGLDPVDISIDITGVLELKIYYPGSNWGENTALGDVALWT